MGWTVLPTIIPVTKISLLNADRGFIYLSSPPKCIMSIVRTKWLRLSDIPTVLCASTFHVIGSVKSPLSIPTSKSIDSSFSLSENISGGGSDL